ncbi:tRNA (cytosine(38)-C(5))-methyltransferase-like isoform X2 [Babylonia areolata]|uniref:tRNA (cytosine(38)-C(5))-methyltransferase-like isoform X2 n=1 Tax=Babylonia areolata TaxID=304850 RepID=UPI003FD6534A
MASEESQESFAGRLRVLELYSGIGGMHWALKESGVDYDIVQAMDVNTSANAIYQHNFPEVSICASSISKLTLEQLAKWSPNTVLMSPPCQPFTRVGKKQDCQDPRTQSFLHLLDLLRKLDHKPEYILVENVKGFEVSETRSLLVDMLQDCKYAFQEFLLTPLQFGVPNCRMRYYLIAKSKPLEFAFWTSNKILDTVPMEALQWLRYRQSKEIDDSDLPVATPSLHCQQCRAQRQRVVKSPSLSFAITQKTAGGDTAVVPDHPCRQHAARDRAHHACQSDPSSSAHRCDRQCGAGDASCEVCRCRDSPHGHLASPEATAQDSRTADCAHRCAAACSSCGGGGGGQEGRRRSTGDIPEGGISALSLAEAGRNMRHCEEEDALVCVDGTHLREYLEQGGEEHFRPYLVPDKDLRMFVIMDIVHPSFKKSSCFTKRYGHYVEGAGSLVMMTDDIKSSPRGSARSSVTVCWATA